MNTSCLPSTRIIPRVSSISLLFLGTILLGNCGQPNRLGVTETPQEILDAKLANPEQELSATKSVALIRYCSELGQQNATATTDKEAVTILGDTGTGKSTSANYWAGCDMVLRTPEELEEMGIEGETEDVIVVHTDSEQPGVASIGHGEGSHTLIPQIIQDPNRATRVYIDCPGFSDNRGAEINIANAINIRYALRQAGGVKAVFLASYPGLITNRGACIRNLENMCQQLFGGIDNLRRHQDSVLLGMNRVPQNTHKVNTGGLTNHANTRPACIPL